MVAREKERPCYHVSAENRGKFFAQPTIHRPDPLDPNPFLPQISRMAADTKLRYGNR
jgi:hypothetical protein